MAGGLPNREVMLDGKFRWRAVSIVHSACIGYRDAIVPVSHRDPSGVDWGDNVRTVASLPVIATLVDDRIEIGVEAMVPIVSDADRLAEEATAGMFRLQDLTLLINQQVKTVQ